MIKKIACYDGVDSRDRASCASAFDTSIDIKCLETGETIFKGLKNKVIIPGSGLIARKLFDINTPEITPSYNEVIGSAMYSPVVQITNPRNPGMYSGCEDVINIQIDQLNADHKGSVDADGNPYPTIEHLDFKTNANPVEHKVLLYCVGIDGCGSENSQVYPVDYRKWIHPDDLIPFRFQLGTNDLSDELRHTYFGRTYINNKEYIAYYFKRFEGTPTLVQQFIDGTPVDKTIYDTDRDVSAETYVELNLKITKEDIRDYFVATVGIDEARINSISLCSAYPVGELDEKGVPRIYFNDIRPLTKLHIPNEQLIDVTKGIEIIYHIYM